MKKRIINDKVKYFLLFTFFIVISYLSLLGVYHLASDKSTFFALNIFSKNLLIQILGLLVLYYLMDALRFYYSLKAMKIEISFLYILKISFINIFISNITPSATGGGFAQIYFLGKKGVSMGAAAAGSSIRTALPFIFFSVFTPIILIFDKNIDRLFPNRNITLFILIMLLVDGIILILLLTIIKKPEKMIQIINRIIHTFVRKKRGKKFLTFLNHVEQFILNFSENIQQYFKGNKTDVFLSILFSILFLLTLFSFPVLLIRDLNPVIPIVGIIASQIVITSFMYFAPTPGASGIAEGAFALLFSTYIDQKNLVTLIFAWRLTTIYLGVLIGFVFFYYETHKVRKYSVSEVKEAR